MIVEDDAKRGDIGTTSAHTPRARNGWVPIRSPPTATSANLGVTPFLDAELGLFVLVRTSNPDSDEIQGNALVDGCICGGDACHFVATLGKASVASCGLSNVGAVVGDKVGRG